MDRVRSHFFQDEWEGKYCFVEVEGNGVCLFFCGCSVQLKKYNIERHFKTNHNSCDLNYLCQSEIRRKNYIDDLNKLTSRPSIVKKCWGISNNANTASFRISHITAKKRLSFQDGELIKTAASCLALNPFSMAFRMSVT